MSASDAAWADESDAIVRGLAHALSNRILALGMAGESLDDPDERARADARAQVRVEAERLAQITRLLKLLPRDGQGRPQALQLAEVLADALALHAHHLELRDSPVSTAVAASALPVRVERWALLRALVLLVAAARRAARDATSRGGAVVISVEGSDEECWVRSEGRLGAPGGDLESLATAMGGRVESDGGLRLVLPSLAAVRRREGR